MDQRTQFIAAVLSDEWSFAEVCRRFGVSRPTGYKWLRRYQEGGFSELTDRSRAPRTQPHATPPEVVELIIAARLAHPTWGPRKLLAFLSKRYPGVSLPVVSTVGAVLKRHGLVVGRRKRQRGRPGSNPLGDPAGPNRSWSIDFKGQFQLGNGQWCYPLTLMDGYARYLFRCQARPNVQTDGVWPIMEAVFLEFGLPDAIRHDNGAPFATMSFTGLTHLSAWWVAHGIRLERTTPGRPQQNGRLERFHRTLKAETASPPQANAELQQMRFATFLRTYNEERPHEALDDDVPDAHYEASPRRSTRRLPEPDYPEDAECRTVKSSGAVRFHGMIFHISRALAGQRIAFVPTGTGQWEVRYYAHPLGVLDEAAETLSNGNTTRKARRDRPRSRPVFLPLTGANL